MKDISKYILEYDLSEIRFVKLNSLTNHEIMELFHELEYKFYAIEKLNIPYVRKKNQLKIIEEKAREVIEYIAELYKEVFKDWLEKHALLSPSTWAKKRFEELEELGEHEDAIIDYMEDEFERYSSDDLFSYKNFNIKTLKKDFPKLYDWLEIIKNDMNTSLDIDQDEYTIDTSLDLFLEEGKESLKSVYNYSKSLFTQIIIEFYKNIVFPVWYKHWKAEGIEGTRRGIEAAYSDLKSIKSKSIANAFMIIDHCSNINHQTGSMQDYLEVLDIDYRELSNLDTDVWEKEIRTPIT